MHFSNRFLTIMNAKNPFPIALAVLTSPNAIAWYKAVAVEVMLYFCEGLVILMAATIRAGQVFRELIHSAYEIILEINCKRIHCVIGIEPIGLIPSVVMAHPDRIAMSDRSLRRELKDLDIACYRLGKALDSDAIVSNRILITPPPRYPRLKSVTTATKAPRQKKSTRLPKGKKPTTVRGVSID